MKCNNCGSNEQDNAVFCSNCGTQLRSNDLPDYMPPLSTMHAPTPAQYPSPPAPPVNPMPQDPYDPYNMPGNTQPDPHQNAGQNPYQNPPPYYQQTPPPYYQQTPPPYQPNTAAKSGKATGSLICGIISLFCFGFILGVIAVILGFMGRTECKQLGLPTSTATAGIVIGIIGIIGWAALLPFTLNM